MWPSKLSPEQRIQIIEQYEKMIPVEIIAKEFGVHHSYPSLLARRRGKPTRAGLVNQRFKQPDHKENEDVEPTSAGTE